MTKKGDTSTAKDMPSKSEEMQRIERMAEVLETLRHDIHGISHTMQTQQPAGRGSHSN